MLTETAKRDGRESAMVQAFFFVIPAALTLTYWLATFGG